MDNKFEELQNGIEIRIIFFSIHKKTETCKTSKNDNDEGNVIGLRYFKLARRARMTSRRGLAL